MAFPAVREKGETALLSARVGFLHGTAQFFLQMGVFFGNGPRQGQPRRRQMKLTASVLVALALAAVPATALAQPPTQQSAAAKICAGLEKALGTSTFKATYGVNAGRSDAFGKCVSRWAKIEQQDTQKATRLCAAEQNDANFAANHGTKTFGQFYGTGKQGKNAFGRCVSSKVRTLTAQQALATVNAAHACATERAAGPPAFKVKYGTNANKSNAFGRCVSVKATAK
jgi:hypothetical protein